MMNARNYPWTWKMISALLSALVLVVIFLSGITIPAAQVHAGQGKAALFDPMVKIQSLPIKKNVDEVLAKISKDVSKETGLAQNLITFYWQNFEGINWNGKKMPDYPILVDLYVARFLKDDVIQKVMIAVANALEEHVGISKKKVFIHAHIAQSGQVYISGEVMKWDQEKK